MKNYIHFLNEDIDEEIPRYYICINDINVNTEKKMNITYHKTYKAYSNEDERITTNGWDFNFIHIINDNGNLAPYNKMYFMEYDSPEAKKLINYIEKKKEELRLKHLDVDPYGEEDWVKESVDNDNDDNYIVYVPIKNNSEYNKLIDFLKENEFIWAGGKKLGEYNNSVNWKFNTKDRFYYLCPNKYRKKLFNWSTRTKNKKYDNDFYDDIEMFYVESVDWYINNYDNIENIMNERRIEIKNKKEEMKLKMLNIDPYGEEDWSDMNEKKIPYQKTLCKDLWDDDILNERIENKLVKIAKDFFEDVELDTEIIDIYLTGSMTNYNYVVSSDIDVHIVIDFADVNEDTELVKKAIDGQRFIWNLRHNITIKGHDVELYIQDKGEEHRSSGLYSLLNHEWVKKPKYDRPDVDTEDIDVKYEARVSDIIRFEKLSKNQLDPDEAQEYYDNATELKSKIMKARKSGLSEEGEFSIENLVFKKLRKEGKFKKLIDSISRFYDKIYSQD